MSDIDIAYLAGLMDGEGSFSIQVDTRKSKNTDNLSIRFYPRITMTIQYGPDVLNLLVEQFGGKVYEYGDKGNKYYLGKLEDIKVATAKLIPFLHIKKDIAIRFLETLNKFPTKRANHTRGERTWSRELALEVAEVALTLNAASTTRERKQLGYLETIKKVYDDVV